MRAHNLLAPGGVASVITSDKWLETGYGVSLQKAIRPYLVAVYGQKERSFGADINTVISVYSRARMMDPVSFTYIERYGEPGVRRSTRIERRKLEPGKWFYLRAPKIFMEKILPKLTHRLGDFAEVKFGIKTGANDFFYMKNISHLYETDCLANTERFKDIQAKTLTELERQGLIYIENEGGERWVLDRKDVLPIIRSPRELNTYIINESFSFVFSPSPHNNPGNHSIRYIKWGESVKLIISKGGSKGESIVGFNNLVSVASHNPYWFNISDLKPAQLISYKFIDQKHCIPICKKPMLADHTCDMIYPKNIDETTLWIFLNSSLFILIKELYGLRMGAGALQILTQDLSNMPVPKLSTIKTDEILLNKFDRSPLEISKELQTEERKQIDLIILKILEVNEETLNELYTSIEEVVEDRLIKSRKK
jgi:hypothetical protein